MPSKALKSYAKSAGVSSGRVENYWSKAKQQVKKQYGLEEPTEKTDKKAAEKFYKLTMGLFKKMIGAKKEDVFRKVDALVNERIEQVCL